MRKKLNTDEERGVDSRSGESAPEKKMRKRGFASMSPEQRREIASKGGKASHALGRAHKFSYEEAKIAGRKGGAASRRGPAQKKPS